MKIRCSALGKIMTESRSKSEVLSQTAKTYIQELVLEDVYGIKKEFSSRYTDKGNIQEDESIELAARVLDLPFCTKNDEYFENDYIKGTPDLVLDDEIIDIKTSWDGTTFPWFADELPEKNYYWQLIGYMWLTGRKNGRIVYCLVDTPEDIVLDEIRRTSWKKFELEVSDQTEKEVRAKHEFGHIPEGLRVKEFKIEYSDASVNKIIEKIKDAKEYYNTLVNDLKR
jgi:hypothetical protein